uniref:Uncharacterized protein n=1 Tax=Oryzias melastigma TaxID=30732 RepID=A0A3B3B6J2_ORYME
MSSFVAPFKNQQYFDLKNYCIKNKKLFEDPEFPANNSSLFYRQPPQSSVRCVMESR